MIYENLKIVKEQIADIPQILDDVVRYEQFFPIEKGDVVVDIGAHIGEFAKLALKKASKVYAIEPDPIFFDKFGLKKVAKLFPIKKAIGGFDGKSRMVSDGNANAINDKKGNLVNVITFKTFLNQNKIDHIDFLKIDCEGAEYDILTEENIDLLKKTVKKVAGEFHIHNDEHRDKLPSILSSLKKADVNVVLTSVDGFVIKEENLLSRLDYYTEVLFYLRLDDKEIEIPILEPITNCSYVDGCRVDLINYPTGVYTLEFINKDTGNLLYQTVLDNEHGNVWSKVLHFYFINWQVNILSEGKHIKTINLDLKDKKVLISMESKALGDVLAWMPYAEEFRKKHKCNVEFHSHHNFLFKDQYPEIEFRNVGEVAQNISALYRIGWFHNEDNQVDLYRNPINPKQQPMQKTASDILGLEFKEIKPKLNLPKVEKEDVVTIGFHATAQVKYWNNPTGWKETINYINSIGYTPLLISREGRDYMGNIVPDGVIELPESTLEEVIKELCTSKLFVGVGSGLSWLAWACNIPVILISGFSEPYTEMQPQKNYIRIGAKKGVSSGCFNKYRFDISNWNWYQPEELVGTPRQFECSKSITSDEVIKGINKLLNIKN